MGTAEPSLVGSHEEHNMNTEYNTINKRKSRVSVKGDTRQFRIYRNQRRNTGLEYITNTGKIVKSRTSKVLLDCKAKCNSKIEDSLRGQLFNLYWSMGSFNRRTAYLSKLITCSPKISSRKRRDTPEKQKPREKTYQYYVPKDGELLRVCKGCFMKIFGENTKFLRNICTNMLSSPAQRCSPDKRGCAPPGNKRSQDDIKLLINHINKLPSYESHYCRKETSKKYLPSHFTLQRAYDEYKTSVEKPVSRTLYEKYFKNAGLKVKNPKKDTCAQCDKYKIQLTDNIISPEQKTKIIEDKIKHQDEAEQTYESKRNDIATMSKNQCVLSFDLQQCLPTPSLESSVAFYKRQLWTYNLTVHNCASTTATCYIWYETLAKRGANDIGSCVYNYLSNLPKNITHVTMYSDCCPGQNKNSILMAMCLFFLDQQETVQIIDHKFMVSGHSRMECDSDHAKIEKARKTFPSSINHPYDWIQLIKYAGKNKFLVVEMAQDMFFDFNSLFKTTYQMKKTNENKEKFVFRDVKWIRYTKNEKGIVHYKTSIDSNAKFHKLNLNKRNPVSMNIPKAYDDNLCITEEKKKDLMSLLKFIPETFHNFYKNIKSNKNTVDPIISDEEYLVY